MLKVPMLPIILTRWMPLNRTMAMPRKNKDTSGPKDTIILPRQDRMNVLKAKVEGTVINTAREISMRAHIKPLEWELVSRENLFIKQNH